MLTTHKRPSRPHKTCGATLKLLTRAEHLLRQDPASKNLLRPVPSPYTAGYRAIHESRINHPVYERIEDIGEAYLKSQVLIVDSPTGSGKSTQIPQYVAGLLDISGCTGQIWHTQPRQIATSGCAHRVAEESDSKLGGVVGMEMRNRHVMPEDPTEARVVVMTDGLLIQKLKADPIAQQASCIIIDEVHEVSVNMTIILGLMVEVLRKRPDMRLILMSATGDYTVLDRLYTSFDPKIISLEGKPQPLVLHFVPRIGKSLNVMIWQLVRQIILNKDGTLPTGDILIFLPGEAEIHSVVETLRHLPRDFPVEAGKLQILKLYRDLDETESALVLNDKFDADGQLYRKIIVATNIAETSVTFKNLDYVIDSGENRTLVYNAERNETVLLKTACSRSQMMQRFGRAGRRRPGIAIGLYTREFFESAQAHPEPPIRQADLTSTVLTLISMGVTDLYAFPWVHQPYPIQIIRACWDLRALGLMRGGESTKPTILGKMIALGGLEPRRGLLYEEVKKASCKYELLVLLAILEVGPIQKASFDDRDAAQEVWQRFSHPSSDHLTLVNIWNWWKRYRDVGKDASFAVKHFLNRKACLEVERRFNDFVKKIGLPIAPSSASQLSTGEFERILLKCYRTNLAIRRSVPARGAPKWVYAPVRGPGEPTGSERFYKSHISAIGRDVNPEFIIYDSLSLRVEAEEDKISMRIMTSISPELTAELSPRFFGL